MRTQSCSCCRRIRLDGVALIKQSLLIELLEQPPQRLDILVVISDIGIVEIHKVSHLLRQIAPLLCVHHHVLTTLLVVVLRRDVLVALLVVDIGLGDAEFFLHSQLYRQSVRIPASLTLHLETLHRLIAVESILNSTRQHVMDTRMTVGRGRPLKEYKLRTALTLLYRAPEHVLLSPHLKDVVIHLCQVQAVMFGKSFSHLMSIFISFLF